MQENVEIVKRKIEVLKLARIRIDKKQNRFICIALDAVAEEDPNLSTAVEALEQQIGCTFKRDGVSEGSPVSTWLHQVHGVPLGDMRQSRLREYRLRWLDSWIADLQKIVDAA